jgi:hypothetical protein
MTLVDLATLERTIEAQKAAVLRGDYATAGQVSDQISDQLAENHSLTSQVLRRLRTGLVDNGNLLTAALSGLRQVSGSSARRAAGGPFALYQRDGSRQHMDHPASRGRKV